MRLCRFRYDELELIGFFADDSVFPIEQTAEAFAQDQGIEIDLPTCESLLDLLPPAGPTFPAARRLAHWLDGVDATLRQEMAIPLDQVELLVPIPSPPKLFLLAGNYAEHIVEGGGIAAERAETFPYVFMKPPSTTLNHPGAPIVIPKVSPSHIDWECELGVIIGRTCRHVSEEEALSHVAGFTVINDISDRGFTPNPGRKVREKDKFFDWLHGKWHDSFCPMGPCVLSADAVADPQTLALRLTVNGQVMQEATTAQMIFPVASIVSFLSQWVTLEAGDILSTGTPSGVGAARGIFLRPGDLVVASIEGIGRLESPVIAEP
jgi:2-keto-4-pentenoate hydratase/2-oxohepta-3-ene-1,7-dioic acid hydratase in catechol pathway